MSLFKFFVILISYHGIKFRDFFTVAKIAKLKALEIKYK